MTPEKCVTIQQLLREGISGCASRNLSKEFS
jgi:hypothetical protein